MAAQSADNRARHEDDAARWADLAKVAEREEQLADQLQTKTT